METTIVFSDPSCQNGKIRNPGQGGGRGPGKGGRGKGGWNKKKNSNPDKKETTNKKYLLTLLQSTVDVRVSAYETTLKKMYQQLMKDIKTYPNKNNNNNNYDTS